MVVLHPKYFMELVKQLEKTIKTEDYLEVKFYNTMIECLEANFDSYNQEKYKIEKILIGYGKTPCESVVIFDTEKVIYNWLSQQGIKKYHQEGEGYKRVKFYK